MSSTISVCIDVDPKRCVFCGLCEVFCPFNAIKVYVNDKPLTSTLKKGMLPEILRKVEIDEETCLRVNFLCEKLCVDACPAGIIRFNGSCIQINDFAECPTCGWCQAVCHSVIKVDKIFQGSIKINSEKCPDGCRNCFYACPVNAICLDESGRVNVLEEFCIFCGACKNFCPEEEAINISITGVKTCSIGSNAWKTFVERLYLYKPLQNKAAIQSMDAQWPKTSKTSDNGKLRIERTAYLKKHALEMDRESCKKCQICHIICPKGAINITRSKQQKVF
ncbi:MAG: 4Fe-4S binding protein [Nitrososphaerota archaeon]|nr:4Fe-4S binding protein [Candidatus Bathyarchaeota archaeon]MDW8022222.1 4Fe-4S binding protein [Nitrososphaerota archaeon]